MFYFLVVYEMMVHHTFDTILDLMKYSMLYFLPDRYMYYFKPQLDHVYIILWPTLNEMQQFALLAE